jgi:AcrR family transcriptional regulator
MAEPALPMPTRRDRQRAETRERLFRSACAEIDRVGLSDAQIPRIAAAAGVARATFYFHFPTKDDVLDELVGRLQNGLKDALAREVPGTVSLRDVIGQLLARILQNRAFVGNAHLMREVLAAIVRRAQDETLPADPGLSAALAPHFQAAAERGEIRLSIDPERLSAILLASMFGLLLGRHPSDEELEASLDLLADLFLRGLAV